MANMRYLRPITNTLLVVLLVGCTSIPVATVNSRINDWIKSDYKELIEYWGLPTRTQAIDDIQYAEWVNKETEPGNSAISIGSSSRSGNSSVGFGFSLFELGGTDDVCSRLVRYEGSGKIIDIVWKGTQNFCFQLTPNRNEVVRQNEAIMRE